MSELEIPNGWLESDLGELCDIITGKTPRRDTPENWGGSHPWVKISDLNYNILSATAECITDAGIENSKVKKIRKGTLLFSFKLTIGKMAFAGMDLYTNEAIAALPIKNADVIDKKFLYFALLATPVKNNAGEASKGLTLNKKTLPIIKILHPESVEEQRRIVSWIKTFTHRADQTIKAIQDCESETRDILKSLCARMIENVTWKPLGSVATLVRRKIETRPDDQYEEMGVRSFGRGTFRKPVLTGRQIGNKRIYRIHEGDLVFNNVFSWEGAIAVAQEEDHERVGSHRFITYMPKEKESTSEFLCHHFLSPKGLEDIGTASPGSAGRNRTLGLKKLDKILVPVPDYEEQLLFEKIAKRYRAISKTSAEVENELRLFCASVIEKACLGG